MTINENFLCKKENVYDYGFVKNKELSVISLSYKRNGMDWINDIEESVDLFYKNLQRMKNNRKLYFWCRTLNSYNGSKLARYKGIFNERRLNFLKSDNLFSFIHKVGNQESYSCLKVIENSDFNANLLNYLRQSNNAFLFLYPLPSDNLSELDSFLFDNYQDLTIIIDFLGKRDSVFLNFFGNFDDTVFGFDIIGANI